MNDAHAMQIAQTIGERVDDPEGFFLGEDRSSTDPIEQFAALEKLHHDVNRLLLTFPLFIFLLLSIRTCRSTPRCFYAAPASEWRSPSGSTPLLST